MIQSIRVPLVTHRDEVVEWLTQNAPGSVFSSLVTHHQVNRHSRGVFSQTVAIIDFADNHHMLLFKLTWGGE